MPRCEVCQISFLQQTGRGRPLLRRSKLASNVELTSESCPSCFRNLTSMTIRYGERWFDVEECGTCGTVVLDDAEIAGVRAILVETRGGEDVVLGVAEGTDAQRAEAANAVDQAKGRLGISRDEWATLADLAHEPEPKP